MDGVVIFAPVGLTERRVQELLAEMSGEFAAIYDGAAVGINGDRIYWGIHADVLREYEPGARDEIAKLGEGVLPWVLDHALGIEAARSFLRAVAWECDIHLDTNFGPERLIPPAEVRELLTLQPPWDWRSP